MPALLAWLVYIVIQLIFLPITLIGTLLFLIRYSVRRKDSAVSETAYSPMFTRWRLHQLGRRPDPALHALIFALPGLSRMPLNWMLFASNVATRITDVSTRPVNYPIHQSRNLMLSVSQRTTFFDQALAQYLPNVEQVVILGAGWDTRAFDRAQAEHVTIYEVDAPATQAVKLQAVSKTIESEPDIVYVTANFNEESWLDALTRSGFDAAKPTFILWEGVTYYLETQAVTATLRTVADYLAPGSAIAFDHIAQHILDDPPFIYRAAIKRMAKFGEPWVFGINLLPDGETAIRNYLEAYGLSLGQFEPIGAVDQPHGGLVLAAN